MDYTTYGIFCFGFLAAALIMTVVAYNRTGRVATVRMTDRRMVLHTAAPPHVVFHWIVQYCPQGYTVDDADPVYGVVVLSSKPTVFTWGFFYPVVLSAEGTGTRVDLGIKSKMFQAGPLVTRAHRQLAHTLAGMTQSRLESV